MGAGDIGAEPARCDLIRDRTGLDPSLYGEAGLLSDHQRLHAGWIKRWRDEKGV